MGARVRREKELTIWIDGRKQEAPERPCPVRIMDLDRGHDGRCRQCDQTGDDDECSKLHAGYQVAGHDVGDGTHDHVR